MTMKKNKRKRKAGRMLQGKSTISEIAFESGFPNVNAMILAFKRHWGITPGEYRKKQRSKGNADGTVQRDLCNDTCFKSAYLFKNILENNQDLNGMGYFTLNDRIDEVPPSADTFHGGFGLFTKTIFPKAPVGQWSFSARWETDFFAEGRGIISPDLKKRYRSFSIITAIMIFYTVTGMWLI